MTKKKSNRKSLDHTHKYERVNLSTSSEYIVYKCVILNCQHYIPLALAKGKLCLCNKCDKEMTLDRYVIEGKRVKPTCPDCRGRKDTNPFAELDL